jgi:hypothetical protein
MRLIVFATAAATLLVGQPVLAGVAVTDDVPDLTATQTRDLERRAEAGDNAAAVELSWRVGSERHPLHYLLMAAHRGDCSGIERATEYYDTKRNWDAASRWIERYQDARCDNLTLLRASDYLSRHQDVVDAGMRGDCKSVDAVRAGLSKLGDTTSPWFHKPDRHGC